MLPLHLSPFSPPRKKIRLLPQHPDFSLDGQFQVPPFTGTPLAPNSPFCHLTNSISAVIQGARHAQTGVPLPDLHLDNKLQMGLFPTSFSRGDDAISRNNRGSNENVSCLLSMGNSTHESENCENAGVGVKKTPCFILFGQPILTEQQIYDKRAELGLDTGHCKVFLDSDDVGRTLDLSVLGSYNELFKKLESMFGIEKSEVMTRVIYRDGNGAVKQAGDEPFCEFAKTAKRLTILMKPGSNGAERKLITGLPTAERGLDSSNQAGPLSIFA